jgi:hypothetical protein
MSIDSFIRIISLCVVLAGVETLHGIARTVVLAPRVGKARALKLSIVSGSALAFGVCWLLVPGIGLAGLVQPFALGLWLALFMAAFDLAMGRLLLRRTWSRALQDFNPASGNDLLFGLLLLVLSPPLVAWLRAPG